MIYTQSPLAIGLFISFVVFVLGLSFYLARRTTSAAGYYAAGGNIHWAVNGEEIASTGAIGPLAYLSRFKDSTVVLWGKQYIMDGKISVMIIGGIAIYLGIIFEGMNVSFLVGWAFAVAASANLPAILMILFWQKTTAQGVSASILVGLTTALGLILVSPDMWVRYGLLPQDAPVAFNSPAAISIPASFIALIVVSLLTQKKGVTVEDAAQA